MNVIEKKAAFKNKFFKLEFPQGETALRLKIKELEIKDFAKKLWSKDTKIWTEDRSVQLTIQNRLGWLDAPIIAKNLVSEIKEFAKDILRDKFGYVVLLGMGGSSLAPDLFSKIFSRPKGHPKLIVLDSTDPAAVKQVLDSINLSKSLFIVSSKSGSTIETDSFYRYFYDLLKRKGSTEAAGKHFVAITDPGSSLEKLAGEKGFRKVFLAPEDVGGRYSALTYFGLVPAALMGIDIEKLAERAIRSVQETGSDVPLTENPAFIFGIAMAEAEKMGRNKLTLVSPPLLEPFGDWVEQLVAESTGKQGKGIVPVVSEPEAPLPFYDKDRFFVFTRMRGAKGNPEHKIQKELLEKGGHPLAEIEMNDPYDIGALFFFWEMATAVAGICLAIDPFDEPNVSESKQATKTILTGYAEKKKLKSGTDAHEFKADLEKLLKTIKSGDYVSFMLFVEPSERVKKSLSPARAALLKNKKTASTVGFGPRFLHSTGQLHKGGPASGVFIQIDHHSPKDISIPGKPYSFEILKRAQALGDYESLKNKGRRVVRIVLKGNLQAALTKFTKVFIQALS